MKYANSSELNRLIASQGDTCILAFSRGKDALAAWIELKHYFKKIVLYHLYLIPDLQFIEKSLKYFEEKLETKIIRLPHPSLYRWLNSLLFQEPQNCAPIEKLSLPNFDYDDIIRVVKEDYNLPLTTWTANGVRSADSPLRMLSIKKHGAVQEHKRTFMPVYDWNKARVIEEIQKSGISLPVDYAMFSRTFDGLDYRFLKPLREKFPRDYERIRALFPFVELEFKRREYE